MMDWKQDKYTGIQKLGKYRVYYMHGLGKWVIKDDTGAFYGSFSTVDEAKRAVEDHVHKEKIQHKEYDFKQVIVLRKDLNMRKGKMVAQGAHASMKAALENMNDDRVRGWLDGPFTKICVSVNSYDELMDIYTQCLEAGIPCSLVLDSGRTEFPEPTYTAVGVGPAAVEEVNKITGELKLL